MENNCAVLITKNQSLKLSTFSFYFYWLFFYRSVKFHNRKFTFCVGGRYEKIEYEQSFDSSKIRGEERKASKRQRDCERDCERDV